MSPTITTIYNYSNPVVIIFLLLLIVVIVGDRTIVEVLTGIVESDTRRHEIGEHVSGRSLLHKLLAECE
jgi:hypothetical protein